MKKIALDSVAIIDMIELPEHGIVIADYNKRLLVLDGDNVSIQKVEIILDEKPYGVTQMGDHTIAVSLGHTSIAIYDMQTKQKARNLDLSIEEEVSLWGLSYIDETFYIAAKDKILKIEEKSYTSETIFQSQNGWIFYLQIHNRKLFFTNFKTSSFICATLNGDILFKHKSNEMEGPYGFTRFNGDNDVFYVADWCTNKILKISDEGNKCEIVRTESDGIFKPRVILFENRKKSVLIGCDGGQSLLQMKTRIASTSSNT